MLKDTQHTDSNLIATYASNARASNIVNPRQEPITIHRTERSRTTTLRGKCGGISIIVDETPTTTNRVVTIGIVLESMNPIGTPTTTIACYPAIIDIESQTPLTVVMATTAQVAHTISTSVRTIQINLANSREVMARFPKPYTIAIHRSDSQVVRTISPRV